MVIGAFYDTPAEDEGAIGWVRNYYEALHPFSGYEGGYVNMLDADDAGRTPQNFGRAYERLRRVKAVYDPDNLFHLNPNIPPAD
jgi:FAD/FMN-containing dehydrogenase